MTISQDKSEQTISRRVALVGALAAGGLPALASMPKRAWNAFPTKDHKEDMATRHRWVDVDGIKIFYREAGRVEAPGLLLLHGFPSSSHMFRHMIPAMADRFRVIAPDYPGFGNSAFPSRDQFDYSFAGFANLMAGFTDAIGLKTYSLYIQDYGAPVGLRLALLRPDRVRSLIVQNGNAYEEGLSSGWDPIKAYWKEPSTKNREKMRGWLTAEGIRQQYVAGIPEDQIERFAPETWELDWMRMSRPGNIDLQLDLFGDYRTNVSLYPKIQQFFRDKKPPALIAWGRFDPFFTEAGAQAYLKDLPEAELHFLDAGHFALESHSFEIIELMQDFLQRKIKT